MFDIFIDYFHEISESIQNPNLYLAIILSAVSCSLVSCLIYNHRVRTAASFQSMFVYLFIVTGMIVFSQCVDSGYRFVGNDRVEFIDFISDIRRIWRSFEPSQRKRFFNVHFCVDPVIVYDRLLANRCSVTF